MPVAFAEVYIVEDVDREAFRRRARDYFATGFPFSDLYHKISRLPTPAPEPADPLAEEARNNAPGKAADFRGAGP